MVIQSRDIEVFKKLIRFGVLSTSQLTQLVFSGVQHSTMMRRLRALEKAQFITRGVTLDNGTNTWIVGRKGIKAAGLGNRYHFTNRNSIEHEVLLNDLRIRLEGLNLAKDWTMESEMKAQAVRNYGFRNRPKLIPDGLVIEQVKGKSLAIAVELELTTKSEKRYERIIQEYNTHRDLDFIWYIYRHIATARKVHAVVKKRSFGMAGRYWFSSLEDLLKSKDPQVFLVEHDKWVRVSELGFDGLKLEIEEQVPAQGVGTQEPSKPAVGA